MKNIIVALLLAPTLTLAAPPKHAAKKAKIHPPHYPAVTLIEPNLHETLAYRPFDERGKPRKGAAKELQRFLRDHHTGRRHSLDERLGPAIYRVARHYGRPLEIFSGYRPPQFSTRKHSRHLTGSAVDFRIAGVRNADLVSWLRATFHPAGVGYYPTGVHVHLDVERAQDTYWVDAEEPALPETVVLASADDRALVLPHVVAGPDEVLDDPLFAELTEDDIPGPRDFFNGPSDDPIFIR